MVQQLKLEDWTQYYAYKMEDLTPGNEEVFFKDLDGNVFIGEHWDKLGFQSKGGVTFDYYEVSEWHPVTVDM